MLTHPIQFHSYVMPKIGIFQCAFKLEGPPIEKEALLAAFTPHPIPPLVSKYIEDLLASLNSTQVSHFLADSPMYSLPTTTGHRHSTAFAFCEHPKTEHWHSQRNPPSILCEAMQGSPYWIQSRYMFRSTSCPSLSWDSFFNSAIKRGNLVISKISN